MQSLHTGCYTVAGFSLASSSPQTQALSFEKWRELGTIRLPPVLSKKSMLHKGLHGVLVHSCGIITCKAMKQFHYYGCMDVQAEFHVWQ